MKEVWGFIFMGIVLGLIGCTSSNPNSPKAFARQLAVHAPTAAAQAHWHWQAAQAHWRDGEPDLAEQSFTTGLKQARKLQAPGDRASVWPLFVRELAQFDRWDEALELADEIPLPTRAFLLHDLARPLIRANYPLAWEVMCHVNYGGGISGPWARVLWLDAVLHAAWLHGGLGQAEWPRLPRAPMNSEMVPGAVSRVLISDGARMEVQSSQRHGDPWPHRFRQTAWREVAAGWQDEAGLNSFIHLLSGKLRQQPSWFLHSLSPPDRILGQQLARAFLDANRPAAASRLLSRLKAHNFNFFQKDHLANVRGDIETCILLAEARQAEEVIAELPRLKQFRKRLTQNPAQVPVAQILPDDLVLTARHWDEFGWILSPVPQHPQQIPMDARIAVLFAWLGHVNEAHAILDALNRQIRQGTRLGNAGAAAAVPLSIRTIDGLPVLTDTTYGHLRLQQADHLAALALAYCEVARAERAQPRHVAARHKILTLDSRWKDVSDTLGKVSEIESTLAHIGVDTHDLAIAWQLAQLGKRPLPGKQALTARALRPLGNSSEKAFQNVVWQVREAMLESQTQSTPRALHSLRKAAALAATSPSVAEAKIKAHQVAFALALDPVAQTPRESFTPAEAALARSLLRKLR